MALSNNKQLFINLFASFIAFAVNLGINFFLTPFIVKHLGREAYGFVGLSTNIIGYLQLITIALNSMAGRFVMIEYTRGKYKEANQYFSSVFYSNLFLGAVCLLLSVALVIKLDTFFDIPPRLISDVKCLFILLTCNMLIGLLTNVYAISTFIKNRLELTSIRGIVSNLIRGVLVLLMFSIFVPHIWYIGLIGLICTVYVSYTNIGFTRKLTPELHIKRIYFNLNRVLELIKVGVWNVLNKLNITLEQGLDLVIANVFLSASMMGFFALTKSVPTLILSIAQTIAGVFAPMLTKYYALGQTDNLIRELRKSIRILGALCNIPIVFLYVFGASFYMLWLPNQDASKLQALTILGSFEMIVALPIESLWNIFTITNKLKYSTLCMTLTSVLTFCTVLLFMLFVDSLEARVIVLACSRSFWGFLRTLLFLPLYGSYCLGIKKTVFYKPILKSVISFLIMMAICYIYKSAVTITSWGSLILSLVFTGIIGIISGWILVFTKNDRNYILQYVQAKVQNH